MRRLSAMLLSLLMSVPAMANDATATSKPIKPASSKDEASAAKDESSTSLKESKSGRENKSGRESKAAEAARLKDEQAADELAAKIAEKLAFIRKEKETAAKFAPRPVVRSYAPPVRPHGEVKAKAAVEAHGGSSAAIGAGTALHSAVHWSYEGEGGPLMWGKLNPDYAKCDIGERQSPIDIRDGIHVDLDPLTFDYKPSRFSVIDNGHTIQVNLSAGNYINVSGRTYELVQFHFHKPSEERVNGKSFEMVAHLVHKDSEGKLAVVAVLIERGKAQALVQSVWNNLPLEKNQSVQALSSMDLGQILPTRRDYYTYMGSLTTPPCSEGVLWLVMKESIEISPEQLAIFNRLYPMNARPIQKPSGRLIKESN